jgi:hypothetical protein
VKKYCLIGLKYKPLPVLAGKSKAISAELAEIRVQKLSTKRGNEFKI